jgi:hypothetical protein
MPGHVEQAFRLDDYIMARIQHDESKGEPVAVVSSLLIRFPRGIRDRPLTRLPTAAVIIIVISPFIPFTASTNSTLTLWPVASFYSVSPSYLKIVSDSPPSSPPSSMAPHS